MNEPFGSLQAEQEFWAGLGLMLTAEYNPELHLQKIKEMAQRKQFTISFQGTYSKNRAGEIETIPFVMVHNQAQVSLFGPEQGGLEGFIFEPRHIAKLQNGAFWRDAVMFDKQYLRNPGESPFNPHVIQYKGTRTSGNDYSGTWHFETHKSEEMPNTGTFTLSRVR